MASPLTVKRNDYHANPKASAIYTPTGVAKFLFNILHKALPLKKRLRIGAGGGLCRPAFYNIYDPAIGSGRLTDPWFDAGCQVYGCDPVEIPGLRYHFQLFSKFENTKEGWLPKSCTPDLVLCNPPFNGAPGKRLYPEVFLEHIFKLWDVDMPTVMFVPMGFRLNQRRTSKRWRWLRDCGAKLTSIVALPLDTFPEVEFHAEILIFNVKGVEPHYFLPEEALL
jgi:hypothetical protein